MKSSNPVIGWLITAARQPTTTTGIVGAGNATVCLRPRHRWPSTAARNRYAAR
jgi:hypothetical protein